MSARAANGAAKAAAATAPAKKSVIRINATIRYSPAAVNARCRQSVSRCTSKPAQPEAQRDREQREADPEQRNHRRIAEGGCAGAHERRADGLAGRPAHR